MYRFLLELKIQILLIFLYLQKDELITIFMVGILNGHNFEI